MLSFADEIEKEVPQDDSASEGEKCFLYGLVRALKPKVVLETGTHRGKATLYMANAIHDNGIGKLYTCDPNDGWDQVGNFRKFPDFEKFITFKVIRGLDWDEPKDIDFFFCDGFHGKQDVIEEIEHYFPRLTDRAVVVFHDCDENPENDTTGVNAALTEKGLKYIHLMSQNRMRVYVHENLSSKPVGATNGTGAITGKSKKADV